MPTSNDRLDGMTEAERKDVLEFTLLDQVNTEVAGYFAMKEYQKKPTKTKYICILERFIEANSDFALNLSQGQQEKGISEQTIQDLNRLLTCAKAERHVAEQMRGEIFGTIKAWWTKSDRTPPPVGCFDPILQFQAKHMGTLEQMVKAYAIAGGKWEIKSTAKKVFQPLIDALKTAGFDFIKSVSLA